MIRHIGDYKVKYNWKRSPIGGIMTGASNKIVDLFNNDFHKTLVGPVKSVTGGLLHEMYQVNVANECYAVKALNPIIMKREKAYSDYIFSEAFARYAVDHGINGIAAEIIHDQVIHEKEKHYFITYKWCEGVNCETVYITNEMANQMGKILRTLHDLEYDEPCRENEINKDHWLNMRNQLNSQASLWQKELASVLELLEDLDNKAYEGMMKCPANTISHRDLDPKNVLLDNGQLVIIDWESSGPVNRSIELLEVAMDWSKNGKEEKLFCEVIKSYFGNMQVEKQLHQVLDCLYYNKLRWLAYNVKRALGEEASNESEQLLGVKEVISTIGSIKDLNKGMPKIKQLINKMSQTL